MAKKIVGIISVEKRKGIRHSEIYDNPYNNFKNDLNIISELNKVLPKQIEKYAKAKKRERNKAIKNLNQIEKSEFYKTLEMLSSIKEKKVKAKITKSKVLDIIHELFYSPIFENRFKIFIRQMSLVYLITEFESFLEWNIASTFRHKPEILKSKGKHISYEEMLNHKKVSDLIEYLIEKEIKQVLNLDIEEINSYLKKTFKGIDLAKIKDWNDFKECFYRRHLIVHNNGMIDKKYCIKTGYSGKLTSLTVDEDYLNNCLKLFEKYSEKIYKFFKKKFG